MNRLMVRIVFAALLMTVFSMMQGFAQTSTAPSSGSIPPAKIAWINLDQVLLTCAQGRSLFDEIQGFVESKSIHMDAMRNELDKLRSTLRLQEGKITEEARQKMEEEIEEKETALQRFQQDTQKDINRRRDKVTNDLGKKLVPVIEKIAKEKGLNAVQVLSSSRDAWIDPSLIVTEDIIKAFDRDNPVLGSKTPAKKP
jgi:Skp family chaperone for outer membrane proteins